MNKKDFPELAKQWDYERNAKNGIFFEDVSHGSNRKAWWICSKGHKWNTTIANRSKGGGCPVCSGNKVLPGFNDLATKNPQLASEWNYERNGDLKPQDVTIGSGKKVWWKCKNRHEWEASVLSRNTGNGCPVCSGRKVFPGFNDLATINPELAGEWNYEKNGDLKPQDVTVGSNKKVWWKCKNGHEWEAVIYSRNTGNNCPICSHSLHISFPEKAIFFYIRQVFPDAIENYKAAWLDKMELDIYIPSRKVGIEYDGVRYHKNKSRDTKKDKLCSEQGITLIRIRERGLDYGTAQSTVFTLLEDYKINGEHLISGLKFLEKQLDVDLDIDISRDYDKIRSMVINYDLENCIAKTNPELLDEWDYEKNGQFGNTPENISAGARVAVWWKCKNAHSYRTTPNSKTGKHTGCPYCSNNKVLPGFNDLATKNPQLASEWNYERNGELKPQDVTVGSGEKVWWICKNGHEWKASVLGRNTGNGCPVCSGRRVLPGFNDLATKNPQLASEWNYKRNGRLLPQDFTTNSNKKVWWTCKNGHEWEAKIANRNSRRSGCPVCSGNKVLPGFNDLATKNPQLASEWNYERNGELKPQGFTVSSDKKVWWTCKNGHEWEARIAGRNSGKGCPYCAGKKGYKNT